MVNNTEDTVVGMKQDSLHYTDFTIIILFPESNNILQIVASYKILNEVDTRYNFDLLCLIYSNRDYHGLSWYI